MKRVVIESPFKPKADRDKDPEAWAAELRRNIQYARAAYRYALHQGVAPFASHLNYTQPGVLDDQVDEERWWGINAGLEVTRDFEESWFFLDLGMSEGMRYGEERAKKHGRETRTILMGDDWELTWLGPTKDDPF